jgi:glucosyl-dolichyl phosphate glucuronosyltransferase
LSAGPENTVSVIVCAYTADRWDELERAVASVRAQTRPPLETIVVIDGNEALRSRAVSELADATVRVIANERTPGLSGARGTGAAHALGTILAFIDDDAVAEADWLEELVRPYSSKAVIGVGGSVEASWQRPRPAWFPAEFNWVVGCSYTGMPLETTPIRNPIGANMSVRAEVLARAGSFDARLGRVESGRAVSGTAEETEFGIRAAATHPGCHWVYHPPACVRHLVPPQRATVRYFVQRCYVEGHAKALLTGLVGGEVGLEAERRYVRSVLPRGVARGLRSAVAGHPSGLGQSAAIVGGLMVTAFAYVRTRLSTRPLADRTEASPAETDAALGAGT